MNDKMKGGENLSARDYYMLKTAFRSTNVNGNFKRGSDND